VGMIEPSVAIPEGQVMRLQIASRGQKIAAVSSARSLVGLGCSLICTNLAASIVYLGKSLAIVAHNRNASR
jgi:hypothetical protein